MAALYHHMAISFQPFGFNTIKNALTGNYHTGSWGTPDLGVTEGISKAFGMGTNQQGGSNIRNSVNAITSAPAQFNSAVNLYGQQSDQSAQRSIYAPAGAVGQVNGLTTDPGKTNFSQAQQDVLQAAQQSVNSPQDVGQAYDPIFGYLNQAEGQLRSDQDNVLSQAQKDYEASVGQLGANRTSTMNEIAGQETQALNRRQDVQSSNRRLYDELQRGSLQRFGGASSAGEASNQLLGREQMIQQANTQRQFNDTMAQIDRQRREVEDGYKSNLLQLEQNKQMAIAQTTRDFQSKLLQINQMRAQTESDRANARLGALQELRNRVFAIQQQNFQFQQALEQQRQQSDLALQDYARRAAMGVQGASGAVGMFAQNTTTNPISQLQMTAPQANQQQGTPLIGSIQRKADELLRGY